MVLVSGSNADVSESSQNVFLAISKTGKYVVAYLASRTEKIKPVSYVGTTCSEFLVCINLFLISSHFSTCIY